MGISRPQKASLNACKRSLPVALGMTVRSIFRPRMRAAAMSPAPISRPGTRPEINRFVMEASAMEP